MNALFVLVVVLYARAVPPFEAPDAGAHYAYIVYLRQNARLPALDISPFD